MKDSIVLKNIHSNEKAKLTMNFEDFYARVIDFVEIESNIYANVVAIELDLTPRNRKFNEKNVWAIFKVIFEWELLSWRPWKLTVENYMDHDDIDTLCEVLEANIADVNCVEVTSIT